MCKCSKHDLRPLQCHRCNRVFYTWDGLVTHLAIHSREIVDQVEKQRKFIK